MRRILGWDHERYEHLFLIVLNQGFKANLNRCLDGTNPDVFKIFQTHLFDGRFGLGENDVIKKLT